MADYDTPVEALQTLYSIVQAKLGANTLKTKSKLKDKQDAQQQLQGVMQSLQGIVNNPAAAMLKHNLSENAESYYETLDDYASAHYTRLYNALENYAEVSHQGLKGPGLFNRVRASKQEGVVRDILKAAPSPDNMQAPKPTAAPRLGGG